MCNSPTNNSSIMLYNTASRKKELFIPQKEKVVKIFTCGPSIYKYSHIDNFRTFIFEDILVRYLEHQGFKIERALNFTNIKDKSIEDSIKLGKNIGELTNIIAEKYLEECKLLHLKEPTYNPRSSITIDQAVKIIKKLLKKKIAYWHEGDIYYDPLKFNDFGSLFRLDMDLWPSKKKHFKRDSYPGTRWNLGDFILWHGCSKGEKAYFDEELGSGRPSWNVQDPAMATKYLGFKIDFCCGAVDNLYRHHDYNKAIVEGVSGKKFAHYWLHAEHLFAFGKKMSNTIGNIIFLDDLLRMGYSAEHVRFYLIYGHYREKMNFTQKRFQITARLLDEFRELTSKLFDRELLSSKTKSGSIVQDLINDILPKFEECMNNDLDIKCAFDDLFENIGKFLQLKQDGQLTKSDCDKIYQNVVEIDEVLQVIF